MSVSALMTLRDFTLSNARRFYSSLGNPSDTEGLRRTIAAKLPIAQGMLGAEVEEAKSWYFNNFAFIFFVISASTSPRSIEPSLRVSSPIRLGGPE